MAKATTATKPQTPPEAFIIILVLLMIIIPAIFYFMFYSDLTAKRDNTIRRIDAIRQEKVQVNHRTLVNTAELCDNDSTISIRGSGRFTFRGVIRHTRKDRIVVGFSQDI